MDTFEISVTPDFEAFKANILRKGTPKRVFYTELSQDTEIKDVIAQRFSLEDSLNKDDPYFSYRREVAIQKFLGYDMVSGTIEPQLIFPGINDGGGLSAADSTIIEGQNKGKRQWVNEHAGPIQSWEDFEKYSWPDPNKMDFSGLDWAQKNLEENMKVYLPSQGMSIFELGPMLFGYEQFCYKVFDAPDLVDAVVEKVGQICFKQVEICCDYDCVGMIFVGDDFGYKTGLLINKEFLVEKVLPWHKKIGAAAHSKDMLFALHCCGNIESLMEELIEDIKIDARHSFEDVITPVTEAKKLYGDRIALIGGMDMDFMCRASEEQIRKRVRDTLDICMPGGGYCVGLGNTVANYIPVDNYLIMLDESRKYCS